MFLWPRQEVLQLILPQIAGHGKALTNEHVMAVVRKLIRNQTPEGLISFDRWLIIAKDVLKWNDSVISLFWEMLLMATWHSMDPSERGTLGSSWADGGVDMYFLSIFLALHVDDTPHSGSSGRHNFDAFWPAQYVDREDPVMPSAPPITTQRPTTPSKHLTAPPSTPQSPRSPKSTVSPQSPKRSSTPTGSTTPQHGTPHQVRSSAQHLYSLKQKLPFILKVISTDEVLAGTHSSPMHESDSSSVEPSKLAQEFMVSKQALDCLGLILSGGQTRAEESKSKLSSLHSLWSADDMNSSFESGRDSVCFSELNMWIDDLLVLNDVLYPTGSGTTTAPRLSHVTVNGVGLVSGLDSRPLGTPRGAHASPRTSFDEPNSPRIIAERQQSQYNSSSTIQQQPLRHTASSSTIKSNLPTIIRNFSSTLLYVTPAGSEDSQLSASGSDLSLIDNDKMRTSQEDLKDLLKKELKASQQTSGYSHALPQALITGCVSAHVYLLSPYSTATISNSHDCEIMIGAVAGAVILSACERVTLTVACRKLVVVGCVDCKINVAATSANVITGESRGLLFGPFNSAYKSHRSHLAATSLKALANDSNTQSSSSTRGFQSIAAATQEAWSDGAVNCWSVLHDVGSCLESPITSGSPSGYALDAASTPITLSIPPPPISVACHLPYDRLQPLAIPYAEEYEDLCNGAIALPPLYMRSAHEHNIKLTRIRERLFQYSQTHAPTAASSGTHDGTSATESMDCDVNHPQSKSQDSSSDPDNSSDSSNPTADQARGKKTGPVVPGLQLPTSNAVAVTPSLTTAPAALLPPAFNKAFMDWLTATGRNQQLLELIRLDAGPTAPVSSRDRPATGRERSDSDSPERHLPRALNLEGITLGK